MQMGNLRSAGPSRLATSPAFSGRQLRVPALRKVHLQAASSIDATASSAAEPEERPLPANRYEELGTVLVAGASGGVGSQVVAQLVEKNVQVRALARDSTRTRAVLADLGAARGVQVVQGDVWQYATLPPAFRDVTTLVIATGARDAFNPAGPFQVDYEGTLNLISLAKSNGLQHVVLVTSIGADDLLNPLNLFGGVLFWKKLAEQELQRSGLSYTIVRPGGLKNKIKSGEVEGNIVAAGPGTFGVPPLKSAGSILRKQVAEVAIEALVEPAAAGKVVEIISSPTALRLNARELFESV